MPAPGFLLINPRSGPESGELDGLRRGAEQRGIDVRVLQAGDDASELARSAPAGPLGIAGGDGSLAPVADVALARNLPFVCVPYGTRNHFARDIGLDRDDPLAALAAFDGIERRIDVARAGDRLFLNNVSLGLYAQLVHRREHHRRRRDALALARALALAVARREPLRARVDGTPFPARIILVANNHYHLDLLSLGERERLDDGLLHLYAAGGVLPTTWEERTAPRFTIDVDAHRVTAAVDGEPAELETPLEFRIEPKALRVLVPGHPAR
ncbi:MAG: diacylglycerol kinase family protein [Gaiellaceae bacterium]